MSKAYVDPARCKACELCIAFCPKQAIEMTNHLNAAGYKHVQVIEEKCIGCGICYTVCPDMVFTVTEQAR
ncbi:MAG: 4Fe-4S binding protein [Mogibacterium sp.]|nr:4Fe-4S binding protein [Mogibacterium sp.]